MTHLNRFDSWVEQGTGQGMSYKRVWELAKQLGHSDQDILRAYREIRHWLAKNEDTGKANKRLWGKFMLTWLTPKSSRQTNRLEPSNFD